MKFSVLLPTRFGGDYLTDSIRSVLDQPYPDMELVVSDNANTDKTQDVLKSFSKDRRLKVVRLDTPIGAAENWDWALKHSRGDYVLLIGDDDCLLPGYFARMEKILKRHHNPQVITYNAFSFMAPNSVGNKTGYYKDPFFDYGPEFSEERTLDMRERKAIVKDMFRFRNRIPLNIQTTLMSRQAIDRVKEGIFQPPFPDHYALNSLLLTADTWAFVPEKLLVVGVSPKSFGHFVYSNQQDEAKKYLGIKTDFEGCLPGLELNNSMMIWLGLLKKNYGPLLEGINIDRGYYVRRQVYAWIMQYKSRLLSKEDLGKRFRLLTVMDWFHVFFFAFEKKTWEKLGQMLFRQNKAAMPDVWGAFKPLDNVDQIAEFMDWLINTGRVEMAKPQATTAAGIAS